MEKKSPLYLIDTYALIYRSYFAFLKKPLRSRSGKNVSALFGVARAVLSLIDEGARMLLPAEEKSERPREKWLVRPRLMAAVFDSKGPTFRHERYAAYKATRQKAPDDLHSQTALVESFLEELGIPMLRAEGFEADDIMATLALRCKAEGRECFIISGDKDLLQLVGDGVWELRFSRTAREETARGGFACERLGPDKVKEEWGIGPDQILDLLSLTGDSADNIPGVKGIGDKSAVMLLRRYGTLDGVYQNLSGIEGAVGRKLAAGKESAYFSRELIKLRNDVPLSVSSLEDFAINNLNRTAAALNILRSDLRQIARKLDPSALSAAAQELPLAAGEGEAEPAAAAPGQPAVLLKSVASLLGEGQYKVIVNLDDLKALLARAAAQKLLALDFETDSLDAWNARPIGISMALRPKEAFYVPVASHEGVSPFINPDEVKALLAPLLADPAMTVAAHNAKYDYKVSRGWGIPRWKCRIWDTMVAAWLWDPERTNYSLDSLGTLYFNFNPLAYGDIVPKGSSFDALPLEIACRYSAEDADFCLRLKALLEDPLRGTGGLRLFEELEMPLLPILAEMEGVGIKIEPAVLRAYGEEMGRELEKIENATYRIVGHPFNLASTRQLQEVLFVERGLKPGKRTKTGYTTDAAILEELARVDEVPRLILRHRTLSKLKSTYVDSLSALADREGRIHTTFVQSGTATGRLSSREPNLQNIPVRDEEGRRIREAFIAGPGCLLISADYNQIELVILAHLSRDPNLVAAFGEGKDVHVRTAALIFHIPEAEVSAAQRRIAKTINFGVMYGMSAFRLARELDISRAEASAFIDAYFATYAGVRAYLDAQIKKTEADGFVSTLSGRRRAIIGINSSNKTEKAAAERVAINTPIQGTAADIVKTAMLNLDKALAASGSRARMLLQVHDELILECPRGEAEEAAALVKACMEGACTLSVPLRVSVETGSRWGEFH
ncbi:MAG: DNA polymerase I [Treponema sp.]|jgi:DNA polymerase-1|nr:DNA polymerase I [Treponema sp.]